MKRRPILCDVCGREIPTPYCTNNICKECCEARRCPCESWCAYKHPRAIIKHFLICLLLSLALTPIAGLAFHVIRYHGVRRP